MFEIALNDVLEVKFWYTCGNDRALNVRHYAVTAQDPGALATTSLDVANSFYSGFENDLTLAMSIDATFDNVSVQRLSPIPKSVATFSTVAAEPGQLVAEVLPRQVSGLISLYTALAGVKHRGRFYMPYPDEAQNTTNGVPVAGYVTKLNAIRTRLIAPAIVITAGGNWTLTPVIKHNDATPSTIITAGVSRSRWATQRRRQNARF